jgi:hypothetical protein
MVCFECLLLGVLKNGKKDKLMKWQVDEMAS